MKKYIIILLTAAATLLAATSCVKDKLSDKSVIKVEKTTPTPFDEWLEQNFVEPYNIDFKYRFELNESDKNYFTIPADYKQSIELAHLVKYLCIDSYDEVAGVNFTRGYFPKMFFLIGEWEYRNNGTIILGTAESGKKILLAGVNYLDLYITLGADVLNEYYIKTIHHEFTHILNQTKSYPTDYAQVTGSGYVADSWSEAPFNAEYLKNGFITAYSQHSDSEDFAEMLSTYIITSEDQWQSWLTAAGKDGAQKIQAKLDIVRSYMSASWDIDINKLRSTILRRQNDVIKGKVDLSDITTD